MTDETIGLIAVLKGWYPGTELNLEEKIAEYLRKTRDTKYRFTHDDITKEYRKAMIDYISTCDDPVREIRRYFADRGLLYENLPESEQLRIFLGEIQVRENNHFINGFRDIPMWHEDEENETGN